MIPPGSCPRPESSVTVGGIAKPITSPGISYPRAFEANETCTVAVRSQSGRSPSTDLARVHLFWLS